VVRKPWNGYDGCTLMLGHEEIAYNTEKWHVYFKSADGRDVC